MTSFERVQRTLAFEQPDRVPLATGPDSDIVGIGYKPECMGTYNQTYKRLSQEKNKETNFLLRELPQKVTKIHKKRKATERSEVILV